MRQYILIVTQIKILKYYICYLSNPGFLKSSLTGRSWNGSSSLTIGSLGSARCLQLKKIIIFFMIKSKEKEKSTYPKK